MELILLSHLPTRVLEEGFIPAAIDLNVEVTILTDCIHEHVLRKKFVPAYQHCKLLECDIFNPLSVARLMAIHQLRCDGILAMAPGLQPSAAILSDYHGLSGPSWHSTLLCSQKNALHNRLDPSDNVTNSKIIQAADLKSASMIKHFPAVVQSLEPGTGDNGQVVRNQEELSRYLTTLSEGFALVENYVEGEFYTLEGLGTPEGFIVLGGSRIQIQELSGSTIRQPQWMATLPLQNEVLSQLSGLGLGLGRHHVEYTITANGPRIKEIHNGLHTEDGELSLNEHLEGNLFRETINICLGIPSQPLQWCETHQESPMLEAMA
ncbi:hypothetical protein [Hahella sp. CCB-MM4]|uniref:hypothetical protein n=1 Tax=Hahella sp. (strain CCB-MM4) TaxID=1926491 RepID=UPI00113FCED6|nr:hypothetical protein [Hahella sp. CCB-MM4]